MQPVGWIQNEAINKGLGQANKLRVVTKGQAATAYINDQEVTTFNGQPPSGGGCVGVSGGSPENAQNTWQFTNLKVAAIPSARPLAQSPVAQSPPLALQATPTGIDAQPTPSASLSPSASPSPSATPPPPPAPSPSPQSADRVALRIHGSNTIGKELLPALCEEFLKFEGANAVERKPRQKEDETDVEAVLPNGSDPLTFEVQAHGSKTAFEDLASGKCDIGMASRQITAEEARQCAQAGLGNMFSPECEIILGLDGIAVFVNKVNSVSTLTIQQLADIFSGKTTDWSQVGGVPGPINLYASDEKSGTFDTFKAVVLGNRALSPKAARFENNAKLSDEVAADTHGIGFAGMAFVRGTKALAIGEPGATPLLPSPFTVAAEQYPLSRRLYLYVPGNPRNDWTQKFVKFTVSELGGPSKLTPSGFFARKFIESALTKLEVFSWWTSGSEVGALNTLFDQYKKLYPGVGVINATVAGGSGSAARPILQTRLVVGNPPDTWQSHPGWELLGQYVEPNYCEPVTDLYRSEGWNKVIPKALIDMVTRDGNAYAVLTGVHHGNVLWYNKKLLDQNGIKVGEKMTFEEFFAACDKLKAAGISAIGVGDSGSGPRLNFLKIRSSEFLGHKGGRICLAAE